jgi:hypothetical protein
MNWLKGKPIPIQEVDAVNIKDSTSQDLYRLLTSDLHRPFYESINMSLDMNLYRAARIFK